MHLLGIFTRGGGGGLLGVCMPPDCPSWLSKACTYHDVYANILLDEPSQPTFRYMPTAGKPLSSLRLILSDPIMPDIMMQVAIALHAGQDVSDIQRWAQSHFVGSLPALSARHSSAWACAQAQFDIFCLFPS